MTPTHTELCYLTIREAGQFLKRRELSPVELTRAFLDRIEALDSKLQAFITVLPQRAMAAARTAEAEMLRGDYRGPLHGIPIALKDLYDTKGIRTTASSRVMADRVPSEDATTTARLEAAGSILLGKLSCTNLPWVARIQRVAFHWRAIPGISLISPVALAAVLAPQWQRGSVWVRWGPVRVARSVGRRPIAAWWG